VARAEHSRNEWYKPTNAYLGPQNALLTMLMLVGRRRQRAQPSHPYTQGLIRSIPRIDAAATRRRRLESIAGVVPSPLDPLPGCRFAPRCPFARADCIEAVPPLREIAPGHKVACVL
jgi:oligopeptide/dipeptide ABC transporter ATP-binding protein